MDLRSILYDSADFSPIVREERNFAAILFAALQTRTNADIFLRVAYASQCKAVPSIDEDYYGIYFEYGHLRDAWFAAGKSNSKKLRAILWAIEIIGEERFEGIEQPAKAAKELLGRLSQIMPESGEVPADVASFNRCFVKNPSKSFIQSPQTWQISHIMAALGNKPPDHPLAGIDVNALKLLAVLAWSFNAKPDLVVHLSRDAAVCIELKVFSPEGGYSADCKKFGKFRLKQTKVQQVIMSLLGFRLSDKTIFVNLVRSAGNAQDGRIAWSQLFPIMNEPHSGQMDLAIVPGYVRRMLPQLRTRRGGALPQ